MSIKTVLVLCAQVFLIQGIFAQCIGAYDAYGYGAPWGGAPMAPYAAPLGPNPCAAYGPAAFSASNGGGFITTSSSPMIPAGVSVISENAYEGTLAVGGAIPFLGTVAIEGELPTAGAGAIAYGCGNGDVRITAEDMGGYGFAGIASPLGYGPELGPFGYGAGCGCGAAYY